MLRSLSCIAGLLLLFTAAAGTQPNRAVEAKGLPPTSVAVRSGSITVSTTVRTSGLDTYVYINSQPGVNLIYHSAIPATIANDPAWNCPCTAQIVQRAKSGTSKVLTAVSAPFTPSP